MPEEPPKAEWIYLAHCDLLANHSLADSAAAAKAIAAAKAAATPGASPSPGTTPAPGPSPSANPSPADTPAPDPLAKLGVLAAFNLITVIPSDATKADSALSPREIFFPWKMFYENNQPVGFRLLIWKGKLPNKSDLKEENFTVKKLTSTTDTPLHAKLQTACEGLFPADPFGNIRKEESAHIASDRTWSSILAGASQQGDPMAAGLGLTRWFDGLADENTPLEASDVIGPDTWCAIIPETLLNKNWRRDRWVCSAAERSLTVTYGADDDKHPLALQVNLVNLTAAAASATGEGSSGALALSRPFVGTARTVNAGTFTNWLGSLAHQLGAYLDLLWLARPQLVTAGLSDDQLLRARLIEPAVALFHDHANLGLRPALHAEAGAATGSDFTDGLAYELFVQILRARPNGDPNAEQALRNQFSGHTDPGQTPDPNALPRVKADLGSADVLYGVKDNANPDAPVLGVWIKEILLAAIERVDGPLDQVGSHSGAYNHLRRILCFSAQVPLRTLENPSELKIPDRVDDAMLDAACKELVRLAEDENALLELFCLQWNWLLKNRQDKGWVANLRNLLRPPTSSEEIIGSNEREALRNYLQAGSIRLSERYSDALAAAVQWRMADCVQENYNLMVDYSRSGAAKSTKSEYRTINLEGYFKACWERVIAIDCEPLVLLPREKEILKSSASTRQGKSLQDRLKEETASIRSQHFEAAAYLGAALLEYRDWVTGHLKSPVVEYDSARLLPAGRLNAFLPVTPFTASLVEALCGKDPGTPPPTPTPSPDATPPPLDQSGKGTGKTGNAAANGSPRPTKPFWKTLPWVNRLVGSDRMTAPVPTPPSLPVPLLTQQEYDPTRYSGVLILARRTFGEGGADWWIVNVGRPGFIVDPSSSAQATRDDTRIVFFDSDNQHILAVPAPWQIVESFGVTQNVVEYRGEPLGVRLKHAMPDEPYSNTEHVATAGAEATASRAVDLVRQDLTVGDDEHAHPSELGWGSVPGLRYGDAWRYQFLFVPIHNTGALPWDFRDHAKPSPCALWSAIDPHTVRQLPKGVDPYVKSSTVTITGYRRRVPIGQVRLAEVPGSNTAPFEDFKSTPTLDNVRPMYADLQEQGTYEYLNQLAADGAAKVATLPPNLPARTILLYHGGEKSSEVAFRIRPPATAFENWAITQWSRLTPEHTATPGFENEIQHLIADTRHLVHDLSAGNTPTAWKAQGLESTQLLDDIAVTGVWVKISQVLDFAGTKGTVLKDGVIPFTPPDNYSIPPANASDDVVHSAIRKVVQMAATKSVRVVLGDDTAGVKFDQSTCTITVPQGCIVQIELIPCVRPDLLDQQFGIYQQFREPPKDFTERDWRPILDSGFRIWVEGAAAAAPLPDPMEVWDALRLGRVGSHGREAHPVERLEVAVQPLIASEKKDPASKATDQEIALLRKWALVSEAEIAIQPWSWRGLPENRYETLASLRKAAVDPCGQPSVGLDAKEADAFHELIKAETASFNEVPPEVADVKSHALNYAAPLYVHLQSGSTFGQVSLPPFIVFQDRGEQETVPRYYRVSLTAKSRYAGLPDQPDNRKAVTGTRQFDASDSRPAFETVHKRILFGGKLGRRLDLPRIKMVIPLLEPVAPTQRGGPAKVRPGFIVLTRGPLSSPWHRLIAEVDWARVTIGDPAEDPVVKELPEFGPDPITASEGFDWSFKSITNLKTSSLSDGQAFGLTYERETGLPAFPNAGFYFEPPFTSLDREKSADVKGSATGLSAITGDDVRHDWFAKMRFHWEIRPPYVMDNPADWLVSELTQPWQVRLLSPFDGISFDGDRSGQPVPLRHVRLVSEGGETIPRFSRLDGSGNAGDRSAVSLGRPRPPVYSTGGKPSRGSDPAALLLFVAWRLVPDFLTAEHSKVVHSITLFPASDSVRLIHHNQAAGGARADGGNFLLLFGREEAVSAFTRRDKTSLNAANGLEALLADLFPGDDDKDAKMMITRCSPPILAHE